MDKTEKFIKEELKDRDDHIDLDIDSVIAGTHSSIKRRATRRKTMYSSPVVILLIVIGLALFPQQDEILTLPGSELLIAGWEYSWTETQDVYLEESEESLLYDKTVDYLFDDNYYTYIDDTNDLLDENDLEDLMGYLEEV